MITHSKDGKAHFVPPKRADLKVKAPLQRPPALASNFPSSQAKPSPYFIFTGVTPQSTESVRRVLTENDHAYDMWEKKRRYAHNHFAHSALTRYALGAPPALLQADWEYDRGYIALLDPREDGRENDLQGMPDKITRDNWRDKAVFGKRGAHSLYLPFFHGEVQRLGIDGALREYLFSPAANADGPSMLCALLAGVVHPFIHIGLGLEFDDPLVVAEGLAQACQHDPSISRALYPADWPKTQLKNTSGKPNKSLLGLYVEYLANPVLDVGPYDTTILINDRLRQAVTPERTPVLHDLVARWDTSDLSEKGLAARLEEVAWVATLLCGATSRPGYKTRIDFFLMHLLTSSLFLPAYMRRLDDKERRIILQSYALTLFHICSTRGRPALFPQVAMGYPVDAAGPLPRAGEGAAEHKLPMIGDGSAAEDNPWFGIVENALVAYDSHVPKSIRSLLHYSQLYGWRPAGTVPGAFNADGSEIVPGISAVDGTVFVRIAGEIMKYTGWVKESARGGDGNDNEWDRSALGWDGAWEDETPQKV
ncbi:hypothetical protein CC85DRAFT_287064 [Cutaneotrichosporon oleaginosum]|uniref:Uncharacterized protein n=1 Tax=Cutaneotrichosporon oleaginosum TaxID=879819 RepID=A0A0J0XI65_9TREE|nr:uncharacterized protein CC85DRAFT_287064 [Cutaneotrichosporon oleaginosum]KLT40791.1 hypothetical protein CC85DRAFT_287064 [Cutaneotrichosporon oleaginosum]TXT11897.1 hypothetical protein COLE_02307 [Cutaneotrichosporon oleaginosum]